ncbi:hypothetical protein l11_08170 [Neisseria weaveri LMG 5135]|nr:hypothetical protein l11_08170 [Neisseria weaveri LMG 5135]
MFGIAYQPPGLLVDCGQAVERKGVRPGQTFEYAFAADMLPAEGEGFPVGLAVFGWEQGVEPF